MQGEYDANSVLKAAEIAKMCTLPTSIERPTMSEVVMQLKECLALELSSGTTQIHDTSEISTNCDDSGPNPATESKYSCRRRMSSARIADSHTRIVDSSPTQQIFRSSMGLLSESSPSFLLLPYKNPIPVHPDGIGLYLSVKRMREKYGKLDRVEMSIWECIELLNEFVDESDPDLDEPQIEHLLQTAEAIRKDYPNEDWLHLTGLIHG
ncbi:hypothetical protein BHM03_00015269 [Ensete ventricosum]|nr:hypothetical protein BHM03_00015269 [Ensete ventricosum]